MCKEFGDRGIEETDGLEGSELSYQGPEVIPLGLQLTRWHRVHQARSPNYPRLALANGPSSGSSEKPVLDSSIGVDRGSIQVAASRHFPVSAAKADSRVAKNLSLLDTRRPTKMKSVRLLYEVEPEVGRVES